MIHNNGFQPSTESPETVATVGFEAVFEKSRPNAIFLQCSPICIQLVPIMHPYDCCNCCPYVDWLGGAA